MEVAVELAELMGGGELSLAGVVAAWLSFAIEFTVEIIAFDRSYE